MPISSGTGYFAAVGSIRVLEARLLSIPTLEKMIGAENFEDAFQILHDSDFAEFLDPEITPNEFEKVLQRGVYEAKLTISRLVGDSSEIDFLWLLYDLHNAKIALKGKLLKDNAEYFEDLYLPYGKKSFQKIVQILKQNMVSAEDEWMAEAFDGAIKIYRQTQDPLLSESHLDRRFLERISELVRKIRRPLLEEFVRTFIDVANVLTTVRAILRKQPPGEFLLTGGNIPVQDLVVENISDLEEKLPTSWKPAFREGYESFSKKNNFTSWENILSEMLLSSLESARSIIDGPEPLVAYFWRKQRDAQILRTVLTSKRVGFSEEEIRMLLPSSL